MASKFNLRSIVCTIAGVMISIFLINGCTPPPTLVFQGRRIAIVIRLMGSGLNVLLILFQVTVSDVSQVGIPITISK